MFLVTAIALHYLPYYPNYNGVFFSVIFLGIILWFVGDRTSGLLYGGEGGVAGAALIILGAAAALTTTLAWWILPYYPNYDVYFMLADILGMAIWLAGDAIMYRRE